MRDVPDGWKQPPPELLTHAKAKAMEAMQSDGLKPAPSRLARFYDSDGDYAGASFAQLEPINTMDFMTSDLLATRLLSVRIGPRATRRFLDSGAARDDLLRKLMDVPAADLGRAGILELTAMAELYEAVKTTLSADTVKNPNAWATASKLCARKRPDLFPVRDREVCKHLGLADVKDYQVDWQVFRTLIRDADVIAAIDTMKNATKATTGRRLQIDHSRLRLLDAAIWTYRMM
jgi:hypothetical protein